MVSDYGYPYATLVLSVLSTAAVLAKNNITVGYLFMVYVSGFCVEVGWAHKKFLEEIILETKVRI